MWARFTVLSDTPIASAIAGCVIPLSRSNTIWMRSRCAAGIFHRSAVFSSRICFLVHLTIRPPESDSQSESYPAPSRDPEKRQKSLDSNSYGSGMMRYDVLETTADSFITDAVREVAKADIGFSNGFRFGVPIPPAGLTEADLWNLLPMDARMKTGWVTGQELKAYLESELELVFTRNPWKLN